MSRIESIVAERLTARQIVASLTETPGDGEQELGSLGVSGPRSLFEVFYEEPSRLLLQLGFVAGSLPRL